MGLDNVFDSPFCHVEYREEENIVFLAWKGFCCYEDYRTPTTFALELLRRYKGSQFVFDARNGFEDEKEDVEWGFTFLLPEMAKTDCKCVSFILNEVNDIEEEMNMWTLEFGKYFAVRQAKSYEEAVSGMKKGLMVDVTYTLKKGERMNFLQKVKEEGIIKASRQEQGNVLYRYAIPIEEPDQLYLSEIWINEQAQKYHGRTEHYEKLKNLKQEYVTDVLIKKYDMMIHE